MNSRSFVVPSVPLVAFCSIRCLLYAQAATLKFAIDGDHFAFYCDSNREERQYIENVEGDVLRSCPPWNVSLHNEGVVGDEADLTEKRQTTRPEVANQTHPREARHHDQGSGALAGGFIRKTLYAEPDICSANDENNLEDSVNEKA